MGACASELLGRRGRDLPVYLANRNSEPWLPDVFSRIAADGHHRVAVFLTSAYSSWSSCRQYRENLADAATASGVQLDLALLPHFSDEPGFVLPFADGLRHALAELPDGSRPVFVTHSIPDLDGRRPAARLRGPTRPSTGRRRDSWRRPPESHRQAPSDAVVFCSRSGPPSVPWLEPDINDHLRDLAAAGVPGVALVPIGFVSDHMEVVYDLDTEAAATAAEPGPGVPPGSDTGDRPAVRRARPRPARPGREGTGAGALPGGLLPEPSCRATGALWCRQSLTDQTGISGHRPECLWRRRTLLPRSRSGPRQRGTTRARLRRRTHTDGN